MNQPDASISFYFFDIDDNLLVLPTPLYLWNEERQTEREVGSSEFARIKNLLGCPGPWQEWAVREETFRGFRDQPDLSAFDQSFVNDLLAAVNEGGSWRGPSWPLLVHAAKHGRPIAMVTARGHEPDTIRAGFETLVVQGLLPALPPILGIYTVTNAGVRARLNATDPATTVPSVKKLAIEHAVEIALTRYGAAHPHRFGMSADDPNNVVLAISAMRDCKLKHPGKRFFVINTNHEEFVKLEVFAMAHPSTATVTGTGMLRPADDAAAPRPAPIEGGNACVYVTDPDRAVAVYTNLLGPPLKIRINREWAELDAVMGLGLGLFPARPRDTSAFGTPGYANIEQLAETEPFKQVVASLDEQDVQFLGQILKYENVRLSPCADQDGKPCLLAELLNSDDSVKALPSTTQ